MSVAFPVFVLARESREVLRFDSLNEMQHDLERIDIEHEEYEAWDANAWPIKMKIEEPPWLNLELKTQGRDMAGLLSDLRHFAKLVGVTLDTRDETKSPIDLYEKIIACKTRQNAFLRFLGSPPELHPKK